MEWRLPRGKHKGKTVKELTFGELNGLWSAYQHLAYGKEIAAKVRDEIVIRKHEGQAALERVPAYRQCDDDRISQSDECPFGV